MKKQNFKNGSILLASTAVAAVAGAAIGVLFAPFKGSVTRKKMGLSATEQKADPKDKTKKPDANPTTK